MRGCSSFCVYRVVLLSVRLRYDLVVYCFPEIGHQLLATRPRDRVLLVLASFPISVEDGFHVVRVNVVALRPLLEAAFVSTAWRLSAMRFGPQSFGLPRVAHLGNTW